MAESYKNFGTALTTVNETTIYAGINPGTAIVNGINIANVDASSSSAITLKLVKGGNSYHICKSVLVPIQSSYQALDTPLPLEAGNYITATAANANRLEVIVSVLEIT